MKERDCENCKHFDEFHTSRACHKCKPWLASTDLISRADAIECCQCHGSLDCINRIKALPSADAEPTVIRSRTLLPTKDFKEWAKRVREENPNVIVIPCDAEVVSADAVQGEWIKKQVFNPELDRYVPLIECSVCGYEPYFGGSESKYNYCSNCGARMNREESD